MERLTRRNKNGVASWCGNGVSYSDNHGNIYGNAITKLADYEDAEEQGLLVRLPCKPNEKVWIGHDKYSLHEGLYASISGIVSDMEDGYVIRYTKEEAEKALEDGVI